eukprot:m.166974 g.166974  ORF g.166974 m.166974 type:complete len:110 (+) comp18179_c0_seq1:1229-1558(+)
MQLMTTSRPCGQQRYTTPPRCRMEKVRCNDFEVLGKQSSFCYDAVVEDEVLPSMSPPHACAPVVFVRCRSQSPTDASAQHTQHFVQACVRPGLPLYCTALMLIISEPFG